MAENKQYITQTQKNGVIMISEDVVCTIVARAIEEVEGVAGLCNANKKTWGKSIKLTIGEKNALSIECNINIVYGQSIVTVAAAVQEAISGAVNSMTGIEATSVNVNVCGIIRK